MACRLFGSTLGSNSQSWIGIQTFPHKKINLKMVCKMAAILSLHLCVNGAHSPQYTDFVMMGQVSLTYGPVNTKRTAEVTMISKRRFEVIIMFLGLFPKLHALAHAQRAHDAIITSLLSQNDVAALFWSNNDVIVVCTSSTCRQPHVKQSQRR